MPKSGLTKDLLRHCWAWPHLHEWGHWLTLILAACFIRKSDYLWLKAKLGLTPKCGCDQRAESLNRLGEAVVGPTPDLPGVREV